MFGLQGTRKRNGRTHTGSPRVLAYRHGCRQLSPTSRSSNTSRVLISHSGDGKTKRILEMLDLTDLPFDVIERDPRRNLPVSDRTLEAIQRCNIGVFLSCAEELDEKHTAVCPNSFLIEVGAAFVHFDRRVILMLKGKHTLPSDYQKLDICSYDKELTWEGAVQLVKKIKELSHSTVGHGRSQR